MADGLNGHHGRSGKADAMSTSTKDRPSISISSIIDDDRKSKRLATMVAARERSILAATLLEKADEYAARAASATDATERSSFEAVAADNLADAIKLREEAQALIARL